jgi:hypothetical protein
MQCEIAFMRALAYCFCRLFCHLHYAVTHEEHMSILAFLGRLMGGTHGAVDVEADAIIRAFFKRNPDAAYHVTKLAMALSAQPAELAVRAPAPKPRNWFAALLERRDNFAS